MNNEEKEKNELKNSEDSKQKVEEKKVISINDFIKIDLRVATIESCEVVPDSRKLFKILLDVGDLGKKTVFAGVSPYFSAEELVGKQVIFVANLEPRKMMGDISEGMLLFAKDKEGQVAFLTVSKNIENGTRVS